MKSVAYAIAIAGSLALAAPAATQDMDRVKALYVAASYEEALAAMPGDMTSEVVPELEQYRALCFLALGRENDARATIERLVKARPSFVPAEEEVSPRMRTLFTSVRTALMPAIAKESYVQAKSAYEAKDRELARAGFKRTLDLIDSLPEDARAPLSDMRLLASDFHELAGALPAAAAPVPALPAATTPTTPTARDPLTAGDPLVPAVAVRQILPPWNPVDPVSRKSEYVGLLQIQIDAAGRVTLARMAKPSHPAYDVAVLREARRWVYKPATRGGRPVASEREIEIRLRPQAASEAKDGSEFQQSSLRPSGAPLRSPE